MVQPLSWLAAGLAVATSIALMHATRTLHPPGGATALIYILGSPMLHSLGYCYVLMPVGAGVVLMLLVALLVNNLSPRRRYRSFGGEPGRRLFFRPFPGGKLATRSWRLVWPKRGRPYSIRPHHKIAKIVIDQFVRLLLSASKKTWRNSDVKLVRCQFPHNAELICCPEK